MKKTKLSTKLSLAKETLAKLTREETSFINGGLKTIPLPTPSKNKDGGECESRPAASCSN